MIANIVKPGHKTRGVLNYLYGPGRTNEHTDPHLVASWDSFAPYPGRDPDATLAQLTAVLDLRVKQAGDKAPKDHVWHCSIRAAPEDRPLSDDKWATIARRVLNATGVAPADDPDACRWVAVRHADDHIHIVATKVRGDLRPPRNWNDYLRADKELAAIEKEYGLRQVLRGDRTAAKRPTRAEQEKAHRTDHQTTARERLRVTVRTAVSVATSPEEFLGILSGTVGVLIEIQRFPSGDIRGYKIAAAGDTNAAGEPVWFSSSKLAPDLSFPQIRERLTATEPQPSGHSRPNPWHQAAPTHAQQILDDPAWGALTAALIDAATAGHQPERILQQALAQRHLDDARSSAQILTWRVIRLGQRPAPSARALAAQARSNMSATQRHGHPTAEPCRPQGPTGSSATRIR
ncbi:relaxase/mobilization nuclease domain-containing protein [Streptomyces sp. NBC_01618]|uniref:relaxase/mobilization nuclease domain-containing protein n=1 Tax=Streptomyces sp. NBC_01618 TaxID=2975900 RepID=UPI003870EAB3|nr:relaxase/mobilization nuclease domain-containing protein [Streptomyces sp. NBC_01618]